eukprot:CAMPEP_0202700028 /NCGR_PEP_ID=MMETSP1385-20130828/13246_1 /ASSEMBLY_ACC=CAM_ASM_000861 /TAXON_ID=933848 /ORGANISM="Elphidium margaritaceum" /LENGTH=91 /DNA_ID=CAMNT_0049357133 /DNA_START=18 /DNA_END=289 /DNA_ORIENTATION=+
MSYEQQIEGEADDNIDNEQQQTPPPPPAFNPEALSAHHYMPVMQPQTYGAVAYPSSFEPDHSGHGTHLFQQQPVQAAAVLQSSASRVQFEP